MADAGAIPGSESARLSLRAQRRLADRQEAWSRLVEAGLAWQPDPLQPPPVSAPLLLSSPQEWTTEHLKDAALHVLRVEAALREMGWTLGSAPAQWAQFAGCRVRWISQTALRPRKPGPWPGRQAFFDEFLRPLLERCPEDAWWRRWRRPLRGLFPCGARDEIAELESLVASLTPRRRWAPWTAGVLPLEPPGLAAILAREEALRRGARLIYEWRGKQAGSAPLRPWQGVAWVRFHESEERAAADYLEHRASLGCVLPIWKRCGEPMASCPRRPEADLLVATGRGNAPAGGAALDHFQRAIRPMAPAAVIEHAGADGWEPFLAGVRREFRLAWTADTGAGRRACLIERA